MDGVFYDFIMQYMEEDCVCFFSFKYCIFQFIDIFYFLDFLQCYYWVYDLLEIVFVCYFSFDVEYVGLVLAGFYEGFFDYFFVLQCICKYVVMFV